VRAAAEAQAALCHPFLAAIVLQDVVERRRLHIVTVIGGGLMLASLGVSAMVGASDFGRSFVLGKIT
jgi:hypothetical protein